MNGGHYVAYVKRDEVWHYVSDSSVRKVSVEQVLKCQANMLFYEQLGTAELEAEQREQLAAEQLAAEQLTGGGAEAEANLGTELQGGAGSDDTGSGSEVDLDDI